MGKNIIPPKQSAATKSQDHHSGAIHNEMTTPKMFDDVTTLTENLAEFIATVFP